MADDYTRPGCFNTVFDYHNENKEEVIHLKT